MPPPIFPSAPRVGLTGRCMPERPHGGARARGLTLIELLVTLTVLAVLGSLAIPSFAGLRDRQNLRGVAGRLEADLQHARGLAVARNEVVRVSFDLTQGVCWIVHTGDPSGCNCRSDGSAQCTAGEPLRASRIEPASAPLTLLPNVRSLSFDPVRGTATPTATIRLRSATGRAIHQIVNVAGRVRACSPDGGFAELPTC
jgi:type IV fimbrial biogenesis protein FimT